MKVAFSDTEDGRPLADEECERGELHALLFLGIVRAVRSCRSFLHEEELFKAALTCLFSLDVLFLCQD